MENQSPTEGRGNCKMQPVRLQGIRQEYRNMLPAYEEKFPDFKGHNFIRESYPVDLKVRTFGKRGPRRNKAENVDIKTARE